MWIILKNAEDITATYKKVVNLETEKDLLRSTISALKRQTEILKGKNTGLEIENETLQREVEHWKFKAQFNKDEKKVPVE